MENKLGYLLHSGKNPKFVYYAYNYMRRIIPKSLFRFLLKYTLKGAEKREDYAYILQRVDYYNRLTGNESKNLDGLTLLSEHKLGRQKVYYFDTVQYTRWFPQNLRWNMCPGDVTFVPDVPSIVKSRPLVPGNENSVLMKLNKIRHFIFVHDRKSFAEKKNMAVFRGKVGVPEHSLKSVRYRFMQMYYGHPMCYVGEINSRYANQQWLVKKMTIRAHFDYKFILTLEGNDVASNLKWVMWSNSLAVMPRPTCETWFMEGTLIPNYHYVEIKPDFSDLIEKMNYYIAHPDEAQAIIEHAHDYVRQFRNRKREKIISLLVLKKYFEKTNQI